MNPCEGAEEAEGGKPRKELQDQWRQGGGGVLWDTIALTESAMHLVSFKFLLFLLHLTH